MVARLIGLFCLCAGSALADPVDAEALARRIQQLTGRKAHVVPQRDGALRVEILGVRADGLPVVLERLEPATHPMVHALDVPLARGVAGQAVVEVRGGVVMIVHNATPGRARALLDLAWRRDPAADQPRDLIGLRDERGSIAQITHPELGLPMFIERTDRPEQLKSLIEDVTRLAQPAPSGQSSAGETASQPATPSPSPPSPAPPPPRKGFIDGLGG